MRGSRPSHQQARQLHLVVLTHGGDVHQVHPPPAPHHLLGLGQLGIDQTEVFLRRRVQKVAQQPVVDGVVGGGHDVGLEALAVDGDDASSHQRLQVDHQPVHVVPDDAGSTGRGHDYGGRPVLPVGFEDGRSELGLPAGDHIGLGEVGADPAAAGRVGGAAVDLPRTYAGVVLVSRSTAAYGPVKDENRIGDGAEDGSPGQQLADGALAETPAVVLHAAVAPFLAQPASTPAEGGAGAQAILAFGGGFLIVVAGIAHINLKSRVSIPPVSIPPVSVPLPGR